MEEDIKESINKFEEYLENVKSNDVHKNSMYNDNYGYVTMQFTPFSNKDIENLLARYKELEECTDRLLRIIEDSILKSKVKEKIKELKKNLNTEIVKYSYKRGDVTTIKVGELIINILQELLD